MFYCCLTFGAGGAELAEAVLGVGVDQLTGHREPHSIWHAFHRLHWRGGSGLPQQQVFVYPKILGIYNEFMEHGGVSISFDFQLPHVKNKANVVPVV